jgi:hypothetical protein
MVDFTKIGCSRSGPAGRQSDLFGQPPRSYQPIGISVTAESGGLKVNTPYSATFVAMLKTAIPSTGRKWDNKTKCWFVAKQYADELKRIIDASYGCDVQMPNVIAEPEQTLEYTFQADYIGNSKNGVSSVYCSGGWNAKIPETVLRKWFKQVDADAPATYYSLLGCDEKAKPDDIKKAFKRAARQWHPDLCKEPEAREMFEKVKAAYDILNEPSARRKYDAGLHFEKMAKMPLAQHRWRRNGTNYLGASNSVTFVPLLRCGRLIVKGKRELGTLIVEEILSWADVENEFGQIMVSFWSGDNFSVMWV